MTAMMTDCSMQSLKLLSSSNDCSTGSSNILDFYGKVYANGLNRN